VRVAAFYLFIRVPRRRRRLALFPITPEALGARSQKAWPPQFPAYFFSQPLSAGIEKIHHRGACSLSAQQLSLCRSSVATFKMKNNDVLSAAWNVCLKRDVPNFAAQKRPTQSGLTQTGDEK
jgi:hypothetical protein